MAVPILAPAGHHSRVCCDTATGNPSARFERRPALSMGRPPRRRDWHGEAENAQADAEQQHEEFAPARLRCAEGGERHRGEHGADQTHDWRAASPKR